MGLKETVQEIQMMSIIDDSLFWNYLVVILTLLLHSSGNIELWYSVTYRKYKWCFSFIKFNAFVWNIPRLFSIKGASLMSFICDIITDLSVCGNGKRVTVYLVWYKGREFTSRLLSIKGTHASIAIHLPWSVYITLETALSTWLPHLGSLIPLAVCRSTLPRKSTVHYKSMLFTSPLSLPTLIILMRMAHKNCNYSHFCWVYRLL